MKRSAAKVPFAGNLTVLRADYVRQLKATTWLSTCRNHDGTNNTKKLDAAVAREYLND